MGKKNELNAAITEMMLGMMRGEVGGISPSLERTLAASEEQRIDEEIKAMGAKLSARYADVGPTGAVDRELAGLDRWGITAKSQARTGLAREAALSRSAAMSSFLPAAMGHMQWGKEHAWKKKERRWDKTYGWLSDVAQLGASALGGGKA